MTPQKKSKKSEFGKKVETLLNEKTPKLSELSFGPVSVEEKVGQALMDKQYWAMTPEADEYEAPEVRSLDISLPKRIRVFTKGEDVYERKFKPSPIKRELRTIKDAIERRFRESGAEEGVVPLEGMEGLIGDPVYMAHGPVCYVAFLEHYIDGVAKNIGRAIDKAEASEDIEELERKNRFSFDGKNFVQLDDMDMAGQEKFRKKHGLSKRELLEEARLRKLGHGKERFASDIGATMFGRRSLETYGESDAGMQALGGNYAYKLIMHSEGKHEIAGVERGLPEIFKGLHGLDEAEFRGKFGESKKRVVESIRDKFYREDVPEMYGAYVEDLRKLVKKTPELELMAGFSGGKELLGGKTPEELRRELAEGVADYKKAIGEVSSLFVPEQYEAARRKIEAQERRLLPPMKHEREAAARERFVEGLKSLKKGKMLKDPEGGEPMEAYIRANYGTKA